MMDRILAAISLRRATAGVYYELRTLRQMAEVVMQTYGLPLPRELKSADKIKLPPTDSTPITPLSEEELAAHEADRVLKDLYAGRDPGNPWRPDPNR